MLDTTKQLSRKELSHIKKRYYPTDLQIVESLAAMFTIDGKNIQCLDPCCGEGTFFATLAKALQEKKPEATIITYGVEIDQERALAAKEILSHVCYASYTDVQYKMKLSLIYGNWPYGDSEHERFEYQMPYDLLKWKVLRPGGIMIQVIPYTQLVGDVRELIAMHFKDVGVWEVPKSKFKQVVIVGVLKSAPGMSKLTLKYLDEMRMNAPLLGTCQKQYQIKPSTMALDQVEFRTEAQRLVDIEKLLTDDLLNNVLAQQYPGMPEPQIAMMPDRPMHSGLRLMTGIADGVMKTTQGVRLVKAVEEKIILHGMEEGEEPGETEFYQQEQLDASLFMFDGNGQLYQVPLTSNMKKEKEEEVVEMTKENTILLMGHSQRKVVLQNCRGEEGAWFKSKIEELKQTFEMMPKTYETDGQGDDAIAYLHFFNSDSDWWIIERDQEDEQLQAFGLVCLHGDWEMAEKGYICLPEILQYGVELDLYWTPKTLAEIKREQEGIRRR